MDLWVRVCFVFIKSITIRVSDVYCILLIENDIRSYMRFVLFLSPTTEWQKNMGITSPSSVCLGVTKIVLTTPQNNWCNFNQTTEIIRSLLVHILSIFCVALSRRHIVDTFVVVVVSSSVVSASPWACLEHKTVTIG